MTARAESFQGLELGLREALTHLHDPDYDPAEILFALADCDPRDGPGPVQSAIIRAIGTLEPAPDTPKLTAARRAHSILHARYVLKLTLQETAEQLSLSIRHLTRLQREAIHTLARHVWQQVRDQEPTQGGPVSDTARKDEDRTDAGWRAQVREELAILGQGDAGARCNLAVAIPSTLRIARALGQDRHITVDANAAPPEPAVLLHSSALQHILLTLTGALSGGMQPGGRIWWRTEHIRDQMQITVSGQPVEDDGHPVPDLVHELLSAQGGTAIHRQDGDRASFVLGLPCERQSDEKVVVLAIDDNAGLASLFQSYCKGTRYEIVHVSEGGRALEAIKSCHPRVILLDVLLPDVDGWALLLELRQDGFARSIPIVLCSVTTDERLALELGAVLYLRKPVWRRELIQALDQVLSRAEAVPQRDAPSTPTAC